MSLDKDAEPGEVDHLARLCRHFGAESPQDHLMARKLLERAEQLAPIRGTDKVEALQYLLALLKNARDGTSPGDSALQKGSGRMPSSRKFPDQQENR